MGMDVCGIGNADAYFRASVWSWRPLATYIREVGPPSLINKVVYWHTNDGDGLKLSEDCELLATALQDELNSGRTRLYAAARAARLTAMSDEPCGICGGTGKRREPPNVGPGEYACNGCDSTGKIRPWECQYPFDVERVEQFVTFLKECKGFAIY